MFVSVIVGAAIFIRIVGASSATRELPNP